MLSQYCITNVMIFIVVFYDAMHALILLQFNYQAKSTLVNDIFTQVHNRQLLILQVGKHKQSYRQTKFLAAI